MADRPTPRSIAICALIALRSDPSSPLFDIDFNPHQQGSLTIFLEESVLHPSIDSLTKWVNHGLKKAVDPDVVDLLLETLTMAAESVDALVDLMDSLSAAIMTEGLIDAVSVHGVYLRQVCLGFEELPFESITFLWEELCNQLDSLQSDVSPATETSTSATAMGDLNSSKWPLSTQQVEEFLQETCRKMDQADFSYEAIELDVRSMLERVPEASAAFFLRFMNCLKHKDRAALDALHQFFDHAMIQKKASTKEILQFSAILLALVHDSFGDSASALMATEEAVRVAQQSKDTTCVAFALGKLFENKGQGTAGRRELLQRCAARAAQEQIRSLVVGSRLGLSLDHLQQDVDRDPSVVWRHHMQATAEPSANSSIPSWDRPTFLAPSPKETLDGMSRQALAEAGIWESLGAPGLSGLASSTIMKCYDALSAEAKVSALINLAEQSHRGTPSSMLLAGTADDETSHDALKLLAAAKAAHGLDGKACQEMFLPSLILQYHQQCLNTRDLDKAMALECMLYSSLPPGDGQRRQFVTIMGIQKCFRLCRSKDHASARVLAQKLRETADLGPMQRAKLLIASAWIELDSTSSQFVTALPHLLEAISICEQSSTHDLHCVAMLLLSRVFLRSHNPSRALSVLQASLPDLLARTSISHQGEAYLTQAKCYVQLGKTEKTPSKRMERYQAAILSLQSSERLFQKCRDEFNMTEVYYLQAQVWNYLGRTPEREAAAQQCLDLQERKLGSPGSQSTSLESLIFPALVAS